ncbi:MAG: ATP-binding protein [Acidimicrobiaceae bacterium]|nr:ATP-binding protein [Acidimicrobiaceae bacterium]
MKAYKPRLVDGVLRDGLSAMGACAIEGPRACGKTATARQMATDEILLDVDREARALAQVDPRLLLSSRKRTPLLIDEWQLEPELWNAVRREIDNRGKKGQFILTGSASLPRDDVRHAGSGRIAQITMRPMTLFEQGWSSGALSLGALLAGTQVLESEHSELALLDYVDRIVIGGWPELLEATVDEARYFLESYISTLVHHDISEVSEAKRDPRKVRRFLLAYAQLSAHPASLSTIISRAADTDDEDPSPGRLAAAAYVDALRRMWIIDDVEAWNVSLRSKARLGKTEKRHLVDPSLAASLMGCGPQRLLGDLSTLGFLFESLVTRDVRVYANANRASVYHYREHEGHLEVDLIVERIEDGSWIGIEVKLGSQQIDEAAASLLKVSETRLGMPASALLVVTATDYAYRRQDGVYVVPLGLFGP